MLDSSLNHVQQLAHKAHQASFELATLSSQQKNEALKQILGSLKRHQDSILKANQEDLHNNQHLAEALLDRLKLNQQRFQQMCQQLELIIQLADPIGTVENIGTQPSGIHLAKLRVPIGVIGIIFESRPNVTLDAASLCFKSANACILKGGSEALHSNLAITKAIREGLEKSSINPNCVQIINSTDRLATQQLISDASLIDLVIPRGGQSLIHFVSEHTRVPLLKHLSGNCHVYIDRQAQIDMALAICENAKNRRYGVCNAMESLLIDAPILDSVMPPLLEVMAAYQVEIRGCPKSQSLSKKIKPASEQDWFSEYNAPILSVRVVDGVDQAIEHINHYGSGHTDAIVTDNQQTADRFLRLVDSSSVMHNTSTAFADGFEYGLGAEIGISTDKLHIRGPVGLQGLTSQKYIVHSNGAIRPPS